MKKKFKFSTFGCILASALTIAPITTATSCSIENKQDIKISFVKMSSDYFSSNDQVIIARFHVEGNSDIKQINDAQIIGTEEPIKVLGVSETKPIFIDDESNFEVQIGYRGETIGETRKINFGFEFTYFIRSTKKTQAIDNTLSVQIDNASAHVVNRECALYNDLNEITYTVKLDTVRVPDVVTAIELVGENTDKIELHTQYNVPVDKTKQQISLVVSDIKKTPIADDETINFKFHLMYSIGDNFVEAYTDETYFRKQAPTITWENGPMAWSVYEIQTLVFKFKITSPTQQIEKVDHVDIINTHLPSKFSDFELAQADNIPIVDSMITLIVYTLSSVSEGELVKGAVRFSLNFTNSDGVIFNNYVTPSCNVGSYRERQTTDRDFTIVPLEKGKITVKADGCDPKNYKLSYKYEGHPKYEIDLNQGFEMTVWPGSRTRFYNDTLTWSIWNDEENRWVCPRIEVDVPFIVQGDLTSLLSGRGYDTLNASFATTFQNTKVLKTSTNLLRANKGICNNAYESMFASSDLVMAPALPCPTLCERCYYGMFANCNKLEIIPDSLPATNTAKQCYSHMFENCSSLTYAPFISLTTTTEGHEALQYMFANCSTLTNIYLSQITTDFDDNFISWVENVAPKGYFYYNGPHSHDDKSKDTIPEGWSVW